MDSSKLEIVDKKLLERQMWLWLIEKHLKVLDEEAKVTSMLFYKKQANILISNRELQKKENLVQQRKILDKYMNLIDIYNEMIDNINILNYPFSTESWIKLINDNNKTYQSLKDDIELLTYRYKEDNKKKFNN